MKKILFVLHGSNKDSGATKSLIDIIDKLIDSKKYKIYITVPDNKGNIDSYFQKKGIEVNFYNYGGLFQDLNAPLMKKIIKIPLFIYRKLRIRKSVLKAAKKFKKYHIDLVYTNTMTIIFGALLAKKIGAKSIWHIREFGKLDHNIGYYLGEKKIEKFIQNNSDAVLCVSNAVKEYHQKYIDKNKMFVTYNSYPKNFIYKRKNYNKKDKLQILVAGDIKPGKGQYIVVKAFKKLLENYPNSANLHFAGNISDYNYFKQIEEYIKENKIEKNIIFHGFIKDMYELRKIMDIGIVSSENEAFGRTTIEGMLSCMCMIGRNTGGTKEQIKDNKTGLLYDGSFESLFNKMNQVFLNRNLIEKIAKNGFEEANRKYTNGFSAKMSEKIIDKVLNKED